MKHFLSFWATGLLALVLSGCADLGPIRDYAKASGELTGGKEIVTRWKNSDVELLKIQPIFKTEIAGRRTPAVQQKAEEATAELIKVQDIVTEYFKAVALLADGELPQINKPADSISTSIKQLHPGFGANEQKAFKSVADILGKSLDAYRQRKVVQLIKSQDDNLEKLLDVLDQSSQVIASDLKAEANASASPFMALLGDERNEAVRVLVKDRVRTNQKNYEPLFAAIQKYRLALNKVRESHKKIAGSISSNKDSFKQIQKELKDANTKITTARAAIELAMQTEGQ